MKKVTKCVACPVMVLFCMLIVCSVDESHAGVGVKPTIIETVVSAGEAKKGVYKVVNSDPQPIHVKVEIEDWLKKRTGTSPISVEEWLTISPMELDINPGGMEEVEYTIDVPRGADSELVAMVFFSAAIPTEGAFDITSRFGVSIYAVIEDEMELGCRVNDISVKRNVIEKEDGGRIDKGIIFVVDVANEGNVHLRPTGTIMITDEDGKQYKVSIKRGFPIYPGSRLDYAIRWDKTDLAPGRYKARTVLDYGRIYDLPDRTVEREILFTVDGNGDIS